jgi:hypothetical protein
VNEIGVRCLSYPPKKSTIGEVITWFDKEIKALPHTSQDYCFVRVLKMLQGHALCHHVDGLDAIMSSCNASILDKIPNDITKLTVCIVKLWWTSRSLPYMTDGFCVEPEVGISIACCGVWELLVLTFVSFFDIGGAC